MTHDEEPLDPNTLYADGFEDALIGLGWQHTKLIAVYDYTPVFVIGEQP
jgi:hypothetical protein